MRIEHIAMYVNDLEKEKEFFEIYFGAKAGNKYVHEEIGFSSYFLELQDGARLELMHNTEMDDVEKYRKRTGFIHIAFTVGGKEDVDRITEKIKDDFKYGKITKEKAQDFNTILEYQSNLGDKFLQENAKDYGCIYVREV